MELDGQVGLFAEEPMPEADGDGTIAEAGITLMRGDCLELMPKLPGGSVDLILCDLPYGTTECAHSGAIPFEPLWAQYRRVRKPRTPIVLFAAQPFTTDLINSNRPEFRYCWYWKKDNVTGATYAKVQPMRCIEDCVVFYAAAPLYYPQGLREIEPRINTRRNHNVYGAHGDSIQTWTGYPTHFLPFAAVRHRVHPTQKPTALLRYLIKTYTREGDVVLDNCMGAGSTGVAARQTGRRFIGIEQDAKYFEIARRRIFSAEAEQGEKE